MGAGLPARGERHRTCWTGIRLVRLLKGMSGCSYIPHIPRERAWRDGGGVESNGGSGGAPSKMTRVQIEVLVSGDFAAMRLGPELVHRLKRAWGETGQRLHMLHVEVVDAPMECPRCKDRALYRQDRRGFLQRKLYAWFGLYPWKCASCRRPALLRLRSADQFEIAVIPPDEMETRKAA